MEKKIASRECKFVTHLPKTEYRPDLHLVKETIHYDDGSSEPNLAIIRNFKRPFWVTKPHFQNHKQKKESELLERLNEYKSTQSDLHREVAVRLGSRFIGAKTLRDVCDSPYLYGIDVDSRTYIKKLYQDKYPGVNTSYSLAVLDIETNTVTDTIEIISIVRPNEVFTVFLKERVKQYKNRFSILKHLYETYVPKDEMFSAPTITNIEVDNEMDLVREIMKKAHEWKPDFLAVWNISFDVPHMLAVCEKYNVDPADIFSDPSLPKEYRHFKWKKGAISKKTESGVFKPINPEEQWHCVETPASFYFIDAMSAHRYVRVGGKAVAGGYSLDNILDKELGSKFKKLKFPGEETKNLMGIEWHNYMLNNKPLEYIVYNQYDCMSMIYLDKKTKDLSDSLPVLSSINSFDIFNSGPKKIVNNLHFFYIDNGKVLGCRASRPENDKLLGLDNWIVLLPSSRVKDNGLKVIEENPELTTNARGFTFDAD